MTKFQIGRKDIDYNIINNNEMHSNSADKTLKQIVTTGHHHYLYIFSIKRVEQIYMVKL